MHKISDRKKTGLVKWNGDSIFKEMKKSCLVNRLVSHVRPIVVLLNRFDS